MRKLFLGVGLMVTLGIFSALNGGSKRRAAERQPEVAAAPPVAAKTTIDAGEDRACAAGAALVEEEAANPKHPLGPLIRSVHRHSGDLVVITVNDRWAKLNPESQRFVAGFWYRLVSSVSPTCRVGLWDKDKNVLGGCDENGVVIISQLIELIPK
jgi:hypothetical protein